MVNFKGGGQATRKGVIFPDGWRWRRSRGGRVAGGWFVGMLLRVGVDDRRDKAGLKERQVSGERCEDGRDK